LAEQGVTAIQPEDLTHYFDALFLSDATQVMAMEIDFAKWAEFNHAVLKNHFYSKVVNQTKEMADASVSDKPVFASVEEYKKHIKDRIKLHISSATKLNVNKVKEDETFKALGVDSLHALQIKNKLQDDFNLSINVAAVWQYPTVHKFADFIANELNLEAQFSNITEENKEEPVLEKKDIESEVKNLSLEELMKELSSKVD
jgi:acyl carrier protein